MIPSFSSYLKSKVVQDQDQANSDSDDGSNNGNDNDNGDDRKNNSGNNRDINKDINKDTNSDDDDNSGDDSDGSLSYDEETNDEKSPLSNAENDDDLSFALDTNANEKSQSKSGKSYVSIPQSASNDSYNFSINSSDSDVKTSNAKNVGLNNNSITNSRATSMTTSIRTISNTSTGTGTGTTSNDSASYISNLRTRIGTNTRTTDTGTSEITTTTTAKANYGISSPSGDNNNAVSTSMASALAASKTSKSKSKNNSTKHNECSSSLYPQTREEIYGLGANLGSKNYERTQSGTSIYGFLNNTNMSDNMNNYVNNSNTSSMYAGGDRTGTNTKKSPNRFIHSMHSHNNHRTNFNDTGTISSTNKSKMNFIRGIGGWNSSGQDDTSIVEAAAAVIDGMKAEKNFKPGDNVLIDINGISGDEVFPAPAQYRNNSNDNDTLRLPSVAPTNKYGYPMGEGKKENHKKGPYRYTLATVKRPHFDENIRYYTVERYDTKASVRADTIWMEPIKAGSDGEKAAIEAAKRKTGSAKEGHQGAMYKEKIWMKSCCISCKEILQSKVEALRYHVKEFITGSSPYRCEISITIVNVLVLCSLIVAFLDLMKHAFFVESTDHRLGILLFIAWVALVLELILQVCIRPSGYHKLLQNEQACNPCTALYINNFHLFFEGIALLFVIPDFLPIFGVNPFISSVEASIYSVVGESTSYYILGHIYFFTTRLRLFCLIRHKRNHWINALYLERKDAKRTNFDFASTLSDIDSHPERLMSSERSTRNRRDKSDFDNNEDELLVRAAKLGTALLLVNSHRAMIFLLIIALFVPFIASAASGGPNHTIFQMTDYLHEVNLWSYENDSTDCKFLNSSVTGWMNAEMIPSKAPDVSFNEKNPFVVWAQLLPTRCNLNGTITPKPEQCMDDNQNNDVCNRWTDATIEEIEELLSIRQDALVKIPRSKNGVNTTVVYNLSHTVSASCYYAFLLQLFMLLLVLLSLAYLKYDANHLVIMPLRRMLKIVLKYASNPLVATPVHNSADDSMRDSFSKSTSHISLNGRLNNSKSTNNANNIDDIGLEDDSSGKDQLGSFETEQLTAAVKKITDLLRKCWGVAGAGIISSNLKRTTKGNTVTFNPTVPGKLVYALFGFVGINDFSHLLRCLRRDVMTLINDIAEVLHNEVYRWGLNESGQCNKNLGSTFLMVYRIGDFEEVRKKNNEAKNVIFSQDNLHGSVTSNSSNRATIDNEKNAIHLASLPGINAFGDRALLGLLKTFAGISRAESVKNWESLRIGSGVVALKVSMSFGMDAGWAVEGAVGSGYKIDATYLSSHVNMASRMMSACKQYQLSILLSQAVEELLSKECRDKLRHVDTVYVKGSKERQRIYTYDARHKGVDFFLNNRTDKRADEEAKNFSVEIWERDPDLREMRGHISERFITAYKNGMSQYLHGHWEDAVVKLKQANEYMIADMVDGGKIENLSSVKENLLDPTSTDEDVISKRIEFGDGPCQTIIAYIERHDCKPPDNWDGVRPLTSK